MKQLDTSELGPVKAEYGYSETEKQLALAYANGVLDALSAVARRRAGDETVKFPKAEDYINELRKQPVTARL